MTLQDIERIPKEYLTAAQVAPILGSDPQTIRMQARLRPDLLPFPAVCFLKPFPDAKRSDPPFQIQDLCHSGEDIEVHFCGERVVMVSLRHSIKPFRMLLEGRGTVGNIIVAGIRIEMAEHAEVCGRDPVWLETAGVEKDFFLRCDRHFVFLTQIFVEKYVAADIACRFLSVKGTVFVKKFSVSTAARFLKFRQDFLRCYCDRERVGADVFVHATVSHIILKVIGKEDDLTTSICKVVYDAGIICDQHVAGIQYIVGVKF